MQKISLLKKLENDGWQIIMFFLWTPNAEKCNTLSIKIYMR